MAGHIPFFAENPNGFGKNTGIMKYLSAITAHIRRQERGSGRRTEFALLPGQEPGSWHTGKKQKKRFYKGDFMKRRKIRDGFVF